MALKLSCPSYVIPGTWRENIEYINNEIPDITNVELLFFIFDEETRILLAPEEDFIRSYTGRLTFTVHLPDPFLPEHVDLLEKTNAVAKHWILHPPEKGKEKEFTDWIDSLRTVYGNRFLLENLIGRNHPWFIKYTDWPLCLDTGHALLRGHSPSLYYHRFKERIREIHLHDVIAGTDHSPFQEKSEWLQDFIPLLRSFSGICNIELFKAADIAASISVILGEEGSL